MILRISMFHRFPRIFEAASHVLNFLRFWRNFIHDNGNSLTLKESFVSRQTYEHVSLQCHTAMLLVKAHGVMCPSVPVNLTKTGTDSCETIFSILGGHGALKGLTRNYTVAQALEGAGDIDFNCQRKKPSFVLYWFQSSQRPRKNSIFLVFFLVFSSCWFLFFFKKNPRKNREKTKKKPRKNREKSRFAFT